MNGLFLTIAPDCSTGLQQARCSCGRLLFKFSTMDPAFYVQTKCGKCSRTVEILGSQYAIASVTTVR